MRGRVGGVTFWGVDVTGVRQRRCSDKGEWEEAQDRGGLRGYALHPRTTAEGQHSSGQSQNIRQTTQRMEQEKGPRKQARRQNLLRYLYIG